MRDGILSVSYVYVKRGLYMQYEYQTSRLILRVLDESRAEEVLAFYQAGEVSFAQFEPARPEGYLTTEYHSMVLRGEAAGFLNGTHARYYFSLKEDPNILIGTVSLTNILKGAFQSCQLGYKLLPDYRGQGFATEAARHLTDAIFREQNLHRIEAFTLADNLPSIGLLTRLGFSFESVATSVILLKNGFTDHCRYYLINPDHR